MGALQCLEDREDRNKEKIKRISQKNIIFLYKKVKGIKNFTFFLNYCIKNSLRNKYHVNVKDYALEKNIN